MEQDAAPAVCASQAWIPGRFGEPSVGTMADCLRWLDWAGRARRKLRDRDAKSDPPVCRKHGPEVKNRRCEASRGVRLTIFRRAPSGRSARQCADCSHGVDGFQRLSALRSLFIEGRKKRPAPPRRTKSGDESAHPKSSKGMKATLNCSPFVPAQAGTQIFKDWIPAFAGTSGPFESAPTKCHLSRSRGRPPRAARRAGAAACG